MSTGQTPAGRIEKAGRNDDANADQPGFWTAREPQKNTACYNCRALRQKCDRQMPCSRCMSQSRTCTYPSGTNRGRSVHSKHVKAAVVDQLLSRLDEKAVRDQVTISLLNSNLAELEKLASPPPSSSTPQNATAAASKRRGYRHDRQQHDSSSSSGDDSYKLVSPLDMMTAAVTAGRNAGHPTQDSRMLSPRYDHHLRQTSTPKFVDDRLVNYFSAQPPDQCDWHVLEAQPPASTLRLDPAACDPLTARLIDLADASYYFDIFFQYRNPLLGILDPNLHTPNYVYSRSFTLFSVLCALGCAISPRTRDKFLYPALLDLAEADIQWSIAHSVKSIETIQAIMNKQYWAPVPRCQAEDPSWLRLSHAIQTAREMGIHKPAVVSAQVSAMAPANDISTREQLARNFERTWLYTFIADKGFGITTGRHMEVSWREVPSSASDWWRKPMTASTDRILSGVVETRGILLEALAQRKREQHKTLASIFQWHQHYFGLLKQTRNSRCTPDDLPSSKALPVLAFYVDHGIMMLNAEALRNLLSVDEGATSRETRLVSQNSIEIACHLLDLAFSPEGLGPFLVGFQNNQFIMICHAATEILQAIERGILAEPDIPQASAKVKAIPGFFEKAAQVLPASSRVHVYLKLAHFFASKLDSLTEVRGTSANANANANTNSTNADNSLRGVTATHANWWSTLDIGSLDPSLAFDGVADLDFDLVQIDDVGFLNG